MPTPRSKRTINTPKPDTSKPFALTASADIEFVAAADGEKSPPKITINAYNGGPVNVGYFYPYPSVIELTGLRLHAERIPILFDHFSSDLVGQSTKVEIGARAVKLQGIVTGDINNPDSPAGQIVSHARNGFQWQASVGVRPDKYEFIAEGQTAKVNGKTFSGPLFVVRQSSLGEVSFVALGADGTTAARIAATAAKGAIVDKFNQWLIAKSFNPDTMSETQLAAMRDVYDREIKATAQPNPDADGDDPPITAKPAANDVRASVADEASRQIAIMRLCGTEHTEIAAKAVKEGWSGERTELEILRAKAAADEKKLADVRASRADVNIHVPKGADANTKFVLLEAAACRDLRLANMEKHFKPEVLEAADRTYRPGRLSIQEMLIEAAELNGMKARVRAIRTSSDLECVLRAAFPVKAEGMSTNSIANVLSNVANKIALQAFLAVDQSWRAIARTRTVTDFKQTTAVRLTAENGFQEISNGGTLELGSLEDSALTNQAKTYGQLIGLGRQDIINDDLGVLADAPRLLARNGGLILNKKFWTAFLDNAAFFTAGRGNYTSGSNTNLSLSSLEAVLTLFRALKDSKNNLVGLSPKKLLVPPALEVIAKTIFKSTEYRDTTANTKVGTGNAFAGMFEPVVSPYLSDTAITNYSTTGWYLLADPADLAAMEVVFLNGVETPTIETAQAEFNTLGIQMRAYFDFGVALHEYLAGVKSKGAA